DGFLPASAVIRARQRGGCLGKNNGRLHVLTSPVSARSLAPSHHTRVLLGFMTEQQRTQFALVRSPVIVRPQLVATPSSASSILLATLGYIYRRSIDTQDTTAL